MNLVDFVGTTALEVAGMNDRVVDDAGLARVVGNEGLQVVVDNVPNVGLVGMYWAVLAGTYWTVPVGRYWAVLVGTG
jgi:threonine/homoserine efflux transporter RhtA